MSFVPEKTDYTFEEYLNIERDSLDRHEYRNGKVVEMDGSSLVHARLAGNFAFTVGNLLHKTKRSYITMSSNMKVRIEERICVYPDVLVIHGKPIISDEMSESINNPKLIAEVLSEGTNDYDREGKFRAYQKLDSFQEYVLISQETVAVDVFFREPK
ncbi:MAG: Uma2 family endonuclease, partial [Spirosomaceae bacterium]|nr:Uma2 family endonuclease [Spirosomataceae bacterium]